MEAKTLGECMNKIIILVAALLLPLTAHAAKDKVPFPTNALEVEAYLKATVDPETLKQWETAVPDDVAIVDLEVEQVSKTKARVKGTIR